MPARRSGEPNTSTTHSPESWPPVTRDGGFAALPLQDPGAAAAELERCTKELGFHGAMVNGFTNVGDAATGWYYDDQRFWPFWERAEALGAPIYVHPRNPLPGNQAIYEGHRAVMPTARDDEQEVGP